MALPLKGLKVLEIAGLAPAPFCGRILADFGASVVRIDRPSSDVMTDTMGRAKRSIAIDFKHSAGVSVVRRLCRTADVLIEPFRPGVLEKLGLGPDQLLHSSVNPQLIVARLSGFGQSGPLSAKAGHDINYLAISGLLSLFGRAGHAPTPPVNFAADFAGGSLLCAFGIMSALWKRQATGEGSVIDANLTEGAAYVGSWLYGSQQARPEGPFQLWGAPRGENLLDSGYPLYNTYECADGGYISVGALEPQFAQRFLAVIDVDIAWAFQQPWPEVKQKIAEIFKTKTRDEWVAVFADVDCCVQPVLSIQEASVHPHNVARGSFVTDSGGRILPTPAPKITPIGHSEPTDSKDSNSGSLETEEPMVGQHSAEVLREVGYSSEEIDTLIKDGVVVCADGGNRKSKI